MEWVSWVLGVVVLGGAVCIRVMRQNQREREEAFQRRLIAFQGLRLQHAVMQARLSAAEAGAPAKMPVVNMDILSRQGMLFKVREIPALLNQGDVIKGPQGEFVVVLLDRTTNELGLMQHFGVGGA